MQTSELSAPVTLRAYRFFTMPMLRRYVLALIGLLAALTALALLAAGTVPLTLLRPHTLLFKLTALAYLVRTLSLHVGLVLLVPLAIAIGLRSRRLALAVALVVAWCVGPALWDYRPRSTQAIAGESLRVMTCNLLRPNPHVAEIAAEILAANPDIVCFQEYATHWHDGLTARLGGQYPYRAYAPRRYDMGLAIYSKRPLLGEVERSDFDDDPPAQPMRAVIEIAGRRVALYNLHMYQPWPPSTMARHQRQLAGVCARLDRETLPIILAGDFNSTPTSPTMATFRDLSLRDAWDFAGWGRGGTWPDVALLRHLPGIRIDHICLSPDLTCTHCAVGQGIGSDHRPVVAQVEFTATAP